MSARHSYSTTHGFAARPLGRKSSSDRLPCACRPQSCGIKFGMKSSHPSAESVLDDLGDKVVQGLALMVAQTRDDLQVYRRTFPSWAADSTDRGLLNWSHDRAWAHALRIFDGVPEVSFVDQPPLRELWVGTRYRLRVKKHDIDGQISTYLTQGALDFMEQEPAQTLNGLDEVRLIAGYRWDAELRELGPAVISLRSGPDKVVWAQILDEPVDGTVVSAVPIVPTDGPRAPEIRLTSDDEDRGQGEGTEQE